MNSICVYCGSNMGKNPKSRAAAEQLGAELAKRNLTLVYGGANIGIMSVIANAVMANGGKVIGVMPQVLVEKEVLHKHLTELKIVDSMHQRKALMAELADGFIALPGGLGTLEELFEILTWAQLGLHQKPCALLNINGYYDALITFLNHAVTEQFVSPKHRALLLIDDNPSAIIDKLLEYKAPGLDRWINLVNT
ncbi:MAG: TIGR00730 family Rossman fold protein [Methylococcaceae bacterium]|nr:TIGR00730 family Rossman fold protein [Methylococcaceae bacterium]